MPDHDDPKSFAVHARHLVVHFGDQRAGGVENTQATLFRLFPHGLGDAVRAENDGASGGHIVKFIDEDGPFGAQVVANELVMHDLVPHINRSAEFFDGAFDNGDGAFDAGTESAGIGKNDFHGLVT